MFRTSTIRNLFNSLSNFFHKWVKWRSFHPLLTSGGRIKRKFFHGAVQFDTCEAVHIFLTYLLMIYAYSNCSVSKAMVYRYTGSQLSPNHTFLLMQETLTNTGVTRIFSMHLIIIGISYHIYTYISATRCKRSLVTQQNVLNIQWGYLNWVSSQKLGIGFKFTDVELLGQFCRRYSLFQVKDPPQPRPPCLIETVPIDPELTTP